MRTLLCALIAAACVALPVLAQPKGEQKPEKKAEFPKDEPLEVNDEADQLLRAMRDRCRVQYSKVGVAPKSLKADMGVTVDERTGKEYTVDDTVYSTAKLGGLLAKSNDPVGTIQFLKFEWSSGKGETKAYATMEEMQKDNAEFTWKKGDDSSKDADADKAGKQWDALYKKGAKWTYKMNFGMEIWQSTEVVKVEGQSATVKTASKIGADGEWMPATEHEVQRPLPTEGGGGSAPGIKEIARGDEKVGDWDCEFMEYESGGERSKYYLHKKYGLMMKLVQGGEVKMEVTEFKPVE